MTEKLTPRTLDLEFRDSSFARRVVSLDKELLHFVSLHPGVEIGTGDILLGGNPAMDYHPVQGRAAIFLGMLHAKETGISSGRLGLWLIYAFTVFSFNKMASFENVDHTSPDLAIRGLDKRRSC